MSRHLAAVGLWVLAWCAASIAGVAGFAAFRGRISWPLAGDVSLTALIAAAALAWTGAGLW